VDRRFYGCMLRGVLAVPLDAAGSADFAARVAADVKPKLAVGDAVLLGKLVEASCGPRSQNRDRAPLAASQTAPEMPKLALPTLPFEEWLDHLPAAEMGAVSGLSREPRCKFCLPRAPPAIPKGGYHHGNVLASVGRLKTAPSRTCATSGLYVPAHSAHASAEPRIGQTMGLWVPPIFRAELHFDSRLAAPHIVELIRTERISVLAAVRACWRCSRLIWRRTTRPE